MQRKSILIRGTSQRETARFGRWMVTPTYLILLVMTAYPLLFTVYYGFTNYNLLHSLRKPAQWVAFENYKHLLSDGYFQQALLNTVRFSVLAVIFEVFLGLLVALHVFHLRRGRKMMRTLLLLPYLLPTVTVALIWRMMLSPHYGILNQGLQMLGLPVANWFSDIRTAFAMILVIDIWQNVPFVFLLLYAALQSVPMQQYEAARIDGANAWQVFWSVTFPNLKGPLALCALLRTIDSFRVFDKINLLTGGGPANSTATITQYLYSYGIRTMNFGLGSAGAVLMTILVLLLSALYIRRAMRSHV